MEGVLSQDSVVLTQKPERRKPLQRRILPTLSVKRRKNLLNLPQMPAFVSGILLLYVFSILLSWFPASGAGEGFADQLWHLTLPAVALSLVSIAFVAKHTRAAMITVLACLPGRRSARNLDGYELESTQAPDAARIGQDAVHVHAAQLACLPRRLGGG